MIPQMLCAMLALFVLTAAAEVVEAQDNELPTRTPSASAEAAIERFVTECVSITPGEGRYPARFKMGTAAPEQHETALREVTVQAKFRISKYEVTQELYEAVSGKNPSRWKGRRNSVEQISFDDAKQFCQQLTKLLVERKLIDSDQVVRLPSNEEWEYCCRCGVETRYSFGDNAGPDGTTAELDAHAWHTGNAAGNDPAVGVLKPNSWGLYDAHGYLWEFVETESAAKTKQFTVPTGHCVIRGGSWRDAHPLLSCSTYLTISETQVSDAIGFRCVIAEKPEVKLSPTQ